MNFERVSFKETEGAGLVGYVETSYAELVRVFGAPDHLYADKARVEWRLRFPDGTIATIYDWKEQAPIERVLIWNIGGRDQNAIRWIQNALPTAIFS